MTTELIISLIALAAALFAAIRTFIGGEKTIPKMDTAQPKAKKEAVAEDIIKKTLQSIEDYRK